MKTNVQFETEEKDETRPQLSIVEARHGAFDDQDANCSKSSRSRRPELEALGWPARLRRLAHNTK